MFLGYLQKIGRSLMVPVAVLPAAALLMGIGYWIDPAGWGSGNPAVTLLIKSGAALIDNMGMLFAVGLAFGLSDDKHGSAALTGVVSWLVLSELMKPAVVAVFLGVDVADVPLAFSKFNNAFIGILVGTLSAGIYNKTHKIELPAALSFFSGRRLGAIVASFLMIAVAGVMLFVWPTVFSALVAFGESLIVLGPLGAGIFGFANRLLIPLGLHHALNAVFWFDVAGINDIPNYLSGKGVPGVTGMYQAGFFPIMMFGLPAAALAMYQEAKPEQKKFVAGIMLSGAIASFFTGVTEVLEFSFMFVAPPLYFLHALLTGISLYISAQMQWIAGFGFSAGFIDFFLSFKNPLAVNNLMLLVQGVVFGAIYYFSFRILIRKFNFMTPGRGDEVVEEDSTNKDATGNKHDILAAKLIAKIGSENLTDISNCTTRLRLTVKDNDSVDIDGIKALGVAGVLKPGKNDLQIVIGPDVEFVAEAMKKAHK